MSNLWDDITKTIREGVDTVVEKTEELTKIGKIKVDILNIKRQIDKQFSELGGHVYHLIAEEKKSDVSGNDEVKKMISAVKKLEAQLDEKNEELERVKNKETETKEEPAPSATEVKTESVPVAKAAKPKAKAKPKTKTTTSAKKESETA